MGSVSGHQQLVRFEKVNTGDLVEFTLERASALGLILQADEDQNKLVGLLKGGYDPIPHVQWQSSTDRCLLHGEDWVIEPSESEQTITDEGPIRRAGVLALSSKGWLMNFAVGRVDQFARFNWEWRDLATMAVLPRADHFKPYHAWALWNSEAERTRPGAQPLLRYEALEQKPQR